MTRKPIPVRAQWALHGKVLDDEGYQVLACSNGDLSKANFADALGRFTLGQLPSLPQVSFSYLMPAARSPGGGYLALALQWFAANGQRYADGVGQVDNQGRITTFTSYFCVPYASLAPHGVTYTDMYKAFSAVTLPARDGPPKEVLMARTTQQIPGIDALAKRVAPVLLTNETVCVLGADETSLDERLRFIDTVMGLLPYGYRAKMAAATWTRATHRNHRFRLFFSSEPRACEKPDYIVYWGEPERARIPGGAAGNYYAWLDDKVTPLASLAQLNGEMSFGESADREALELVDAVRLWRRRRQGPMPPESPDKRDPAQPRPAATGADEIARLLRECAADVRATNLSRLRQDLGLLEDRLESGWIDDDHRERYRLLVTRWGLLGPNPRLGKWEGKLYETLLALAFGKPVTYETFCQVEDCLDNPPDRLLYKPLLAAMERVGLADTRAKVIVYSFQDEKKLNKWLGSKDADAYRLIGELAHGAWHRKQHGLLFCDITLRYLRDRQGRYSATEIRGVLSRSGYLAQAIREIGTDAYQVRALTALLAAAFPEEQYPRGLSDSVIGGILARTPDAPTPALLAAILQQIPETEAHRAWDAYVYGSITRMNLTKAVHGTLWTRLPAIEPEPQRQPAALDPSPQEQATQPWPLIQLGSEPRPPQEPGHPDAL